MCRAPSAPSWRRHSALPWPSWGGRGLSRLPAPGCATHRARDAPLGRPGPRERPRSTAVFGREPQPQPQPAQRRHFCGRQHHPGADEGGRFHALSATQPFERALRAGALPAPPPAVPLHVGGGAGVAETPLWTFMDAQGKEQGPFAASQVTSACAYAYAQAQA